MICSTREKHTDAKASSNAVRECIQSDKRMGSNLAEDITPAGCHKGHIFSKVAVSGGDTPGHASQSSTNSNNFNHTFAHKTCIFKKRCGPKKAGIRSFYGLPYITFLANKYPTILLIITLREAIVLMSN